MTRSHLATALRMAALCTLGAAAPAAAQPLDVPFDTYCPPDAQAACFGAATVMGLDPDGDGFLAVRTGPGTQYPMIARIHNGDRVGTYGGVGGWYAISFGPGDRLGWAHGNWLGNHIP
ncbi:SH3 domain-containing protein [Limimaricola cinnabarinus]|uniref:SH3 domain-containing protein n=1 Tax=Limimaricola cinnabarinus TaxID=1125964 RepID=UPI0024919266|nr:SH3 domain-containing protein [Limimaricola cinnabarinus]